MKLLPRLLVDRLPIAWWRPGNLYITRFGDVHFCAGEWVRTIEWNGRVIAEGKQPFPYDREWT